MVCYFYQSQNKFRKRKERLNRKELEKPYLSPRRSRPSQPTRPTRGSGVFFHLPRPPAARWNATEPAGRPPRHQTAWSPPPPTSPRLETPRSFPVPFPPSSSSSSFSCADFFAARRPPWSTPSRTRSHRRPQAPPPCPIEPASTTSSFPQVNRSPGALQVTPASRNRRRPPTSPASNSSTPSTPRPPRALHRDQGELAVLLPPSTHPPVPVCMIPTRSETKRRRSSSRSFTRALV